VQLPLAAAMVLPSAAAQKTEDATKLLDDAKARAAEQHKNVFLTFSASWCQPCRDLEAFLKAREIRPILDKHFVYADIDVYEERDKKQHSILRAAKNWWRNWEARPRAFRLSCF
jgi:thioredoxin-related protein